MAGLIFVFDLDQTLIDSEGVFEELGENVKKPVGEQREYDILVDRLNVTLIQKVLGPAVMLRDKGIGIDAICLLTNNSSRDFVGDIANILKMIVQSKGKFNTIQKSPAGNSEFPEIDTIFDYIMVRQHSSRNGSENPPKSLTDIAYMMTALNIAYKDDADLAKRTFFFDDNTNHTIRSQLFSFGYPSHYTVIKGSGNRGFIKGLPDLSDYRYIDQVFRRITRGDDPVPVITRTISESDKNITVRRFMMSSGLDEQTVRKYLINAGWDLHVAEYMAISNIKNARKATILLSRTLRGRNNPSTLISTGGRRKKTINHMKRLRRVYGKKLTRKRY